MLRFSRISRSLHTKYTPISIVDALPTGLSKESKAAQLKSLNQACQCTFNNLADFHNLPEKFAPLKISENSSNLLHGSQLPNEVPSFKSHVLLIGPTDSFSQWKSKLELDHDTFPYNVIGPLKSQLKNCSIMVNAVSFGKSFDLGKSLEYDPTKIKFICIPEMVVVELPKDDKKALEAFTEYLECTYRESNQIYNPFTAFTRGGETKKLPSVTPHSLDDFTCQDLNGQNLIFVCGHAKRDQRCGVIAPLIMDEILKWRDKNNAYKYTPGMISHIGGHKFAGNMAIYEQDETRVDGIWYKQVTPNLVSLVLDKLTDQKVIKDLYRGHFKHMKS
ncbi:hypothetical protein ACO0QE_003262 [Hanseniaspora vineae]